MPRSYLLLNMHSDFIDEKQSFSFDSFVIGAVIHIGGSALLAFVALDIALPGSGMREWDFVPYIGWVWSPLSAAALKFGGLESHFVWLAALWSGFAGVICGFKFRRFRLRS